MEAFFQHFGKQVFKVYEVEDNKVISSEVISSMAPDMVHLPDFLQIRGSAF